MQWSFGAKEYRGEMFWPWPTDWFKEKGTNFNADLMNSMYI